MQQLSRHFEVLAVSSVQYGQLFEKSFAKHGVLLQMMEKQLTKVSAIVEHNQWRDVGSAALELEEHQRVGATELVEATAASLVDDVGEWEAWFDHDDFEKDQGSKVIATSELLASGTVVNASISGSLGRGSERSFMAQHCSWGCDCSCHKHHTLSTADMMTPLVGKFTLDAVLPAFIKGNCR